jgi:hypothetical protein
MSVTSSNCPQVVAPIPKEDDLATVASVETAACDEVHMKLPLFDSPKSDVAKAVLDTSKLVDRCILDTAEAPWVPRVTYINIPEYWTGPGN